MSKLGQRQSSFTVGILEGRMEDGYLLTTHERGLSIGNFSSKYFETLSLLGIMELTVGGVESSFLLLLFEEPECLDEEAIIRREEEILSFGKNLGKDAVMRPLSGKEETSIPVPKPAKDKKRKKNSTSEDPEPKKAALKPRKNIILLTEDSVRRLRDEDEEEKDDDSGLVARVKMRIEATKATKSVKAVEIPSRDEGVLGRELIEVPESSRIEATSHHNEPMASMLHLEACSRSQAEGTEANISISQLQQKIEVIGLLREEVDMMKAETMGWKESMDRFAAEKETSISQLSSAKSQLRGMKEKSSTQAKKIAELKARLAFEHQKAKSEAEKAKVEADAIMAVYRDDDEATQVQAREAVETAQIRAHWVAELAKCQSRSETLEEIHARGFDLTEEIIKAKELEADAGALASDDDDDDDDESKSGSESGEELDGKETAPGENQEP
ncbi:uncharacterized protein [Nicotiana tomentosiformis]|uniref:uncharacterized protein n=1 Tax=Nicotiana tomentosiformis TaxID=4098 RepID=UPI00388C438D